MDTIKAYGMVLREYRKKSELTQEELALSCNLDRTYIGLLERAKRQPTISTVFKIAEVLGVHPHTMIKDVEKMVLDGGSARK
ncbi:helix-turn-helix domain-containing protein [Sporosarcina sp. FSL K6-5500]|uniref:helix-turn-helix domain-containing protein n=1 Tax=Sporosarcina sp. FSL K6-5500 TaxID=2921558 RepID=UPI0030FC19B8